MADTFTTNLVLTKPEVGASADTWGNKLNANSDAVAALFDAGPALKVANGGTGGTTQATARTGLGLGTMATQNANAVAITGGTVDATRVGVTAPVAQFSMVESGAAANSGGWEFRADGNSMFLYTLLDTGSASGTVMTVTRSGTTPSAVNFGAPLQVSGNTVYHAGNVSTASINESQLVDANVLTRVAGNETVTGTWNFTVPPSYTGGGRFLHYNSGTYNSGTITVNTSAPSGTPGNGDIWILYTP
jgi:hypothetical protein